MTTPRFVRLAHGDNVVVAVDQIVAGNNAGGYGDLEFVPWQIGATM